MNEIWNNDIPSRHPSPWPDGIVLPMTAGQKAFWEEVRKKMHKREAEIANDPANSVSKAIIFGNSSPKIDYGGYSFVPDDYDFEKAYEGYEEWHKKVFEEEKTT